MFLLIIIILELFLCTALIFRYIRNQILYCRNMYSIARKEADDYRRQSYLSQCNALEMLINYYNAVGDAEGKALAQHYLDQYHQWLKEDNNASVQP